ncbi:MAG: hypothetical protein N3E51_02865 [Candidatus Micrarchaeota archaeon]|nr:hypothetical protein [Candidatus Micrarchaeota archaeon]
MKFRGQAALDFLMTYGWAIALVVIIAAVLFALGIFDVGSFVGNRASGFSQVSVDAWNLNTAGTMSMKLSNQYGKQIRIDAVSIQIGQNTSVLTGLPVTLNVGQSSATLSTAAGAFGAQTSGTGYTAKVNINYTDTAAAFQYVTSGTLTGRVA